MDDEHEAHALPMVVLVHPDDTVTVAFGPLGVEHLPCVAETVGSEEFVEYVRDQIDQAKEQIETLKRRAKAKEN